MTIHKLSAFSHNHQGGNPAGVSMVESFPSDKEMLSIAKEVGFSETAFICQQKERFKIRYFSPEMEIPFCGHATIASGALFGETFGVGTYHLELNDGNIEITVTQNSNGTFSSVLCSPATSSKPAEADYIEKVLSTFNYELADVNTEFPIYFANAGAKHLIIVLQKHTKLQNM